MMSSRACDSTKKSTPLLQENFADFLEEVINIFPKIYMRY